MGVVTGTDTSMSPGGAGSVLAGVRRLTLLADSASNAEVIFRGLARELLAAPGAEEVHVHHLAPAGVEEELVSVYMFEANGRLSYLLPRGERAPGVSWVARTGRSFLAADDQELAANVPRLLQAGAASCALLLPLAERGEVAAVVILVRRLSDPFTGDAVVLALVGEFRAFDRVARYGGDEFVVILPNADLRSAAAAAARALERLLAVPLQEAGVPATGRDGISASIGVAEWRAPMSTDELIEACDVALLRSKREGKGRVTRAAEPVY